MHAELQVSLPCRKDNGFLLFDSHCGRKRQVAWWWQEPTSDWEINPLTGGQHGGEGLNQQQTFLLLVRCTVLHALISPLKPSPPLPPPPTALYSPSKSRKQHTNTNVNKSVIGLHSTNTLLLQMVIEMIGVISSAKTSDPFFFICMLWAHSLIDPASEWYQPFFGPWLRGEISHV